MARLATAMDAAVEAGGAPRWPVRATGVARVTGTACRWVCAGSLSEGAASAAPSPRSPMDKTTAS